MKETGLIEDNSVGKSTKNNEQEVRKARHLTKETVNEQIEGFTAPFTRQLEQLTRLVQRMLTTCIRASTQGLNIAPFLPQLYISLRSSDKENVPGAH